VLLTLSDLGGGAISGGEYLQVVGFSQHTSAITVRHGIHKQPIRG